MNSRRGARVFIAPWGLELGRVDEEENERQQRVLWGTRGRASVGHGGGMGAESVSEVGLGCRVYYQPSPGDEVQKLALCGWSQVWHALSLCKATSEHQLVLAS